jgi:hypothetical protein
MSYCRFRNTLHDLRDCQGALEELFDDPDVASLSHEEGVAARKLVETCMSILQLVADQCAIDLDDEGAIGNLEQHLEEILRR